MGQTVAKLSEKYFNSYMGSNPQESKGMLCDMATDDPENILEGGDRFGASKTPTNILKLKCDPRSPSDFDRTPLKIPLNDE